MIPSEDSEGSQGRVDRNTRGKHDIRGSQPRSRRIQVPLIIALIVLAVALLVVVLLVVPANSHQTSSAPADDVGTVEAPVIPALPVTDLVGLPQISTFTTVPTAPSDQTEDQFPTGELIHPTVTVPVYGEPGGPAIAALAPQQISTDTWLPVIASEPGWDQVLLPTRPNGSTGWISLSNPTIETAHTPYQIVVDRAAFRLQLLRDGQQLGEWTVGIGKPEAETPAGRTFVLASIQDSRQTFSPVILPLGIHSASHETFGGGPGTVGIHGWPTDTVFGHPSSDGCIRVPAGGLRILSTEVPIGTPVLIH